VITSSLAMDVLALVAMTADVWLEVTVPVPETSRGFASATPDHSVIWAMPSSDAGLIAKSVTPIPPGLFG
jgi:hypothetical protein